MIYDSSLNLTWLQDANYAQTSGYDADGRMNWSQASTWADDLVYGGYSDWRLPSAGLIGKTLFSYDGSTDYGYNNTRSEIGHLFFELGNRAELSASAGSQASYGVTNSTFVDAGTSQNVSFVNLQNYYYWEAETYASNPVNAWNFDTIHGAQDVYHKSSSFNVWAVRAGDIEPEASVPEPSALWLVGAGLLGLGVMNRKRKAA